MAIEWVGHGTVAKVASGPLTLSLPTGLTAGDLLLNLNVSADAITHTPGPEWSTIYQLNDSLGCQASAFYTDYTGNPSLTVGHVAGDAAMGVIVGYRGCDVTRSPVVYLSDAGGFYAYSASGGGTTLTYLSMFAWPDHMVVWAWYIGFAAGTNGQISGTSPLPSERLDDNTTLGSDTGLGYANGLATTLGFTGQRTSTYSVNLLGGSLATVLLLRPALEEPARNPDTPVDGGASPSAQQA